MPTSVSAAAIVEAAAEEESVLDELDVLLLLHAVRPANSTETAAKPAAALFQFHDIIVTFRLGA
jgi:hypothetical protein